MKLQANIDWLEAFGCLPINPRLVQALEQIEFKDSMAYHSGGGFFHLFLHLNDGRIMSVHLTDFSIEISYKPWESINDYLSQDNDGFGFEYDQPNWEDRLIGENWTEESILNLVKYEN